MWDSSRHKHGRTCPDFNLILANQHSQNSFEHIPRLIVAMMNVQRRNEPRRPRRSTFISPLCHHKGIGAGAKNLAGK